MVEDWFFKPLKPSKWLSWVFVYRGSGSGIVGGVNAAGSLMSGGCCGTQRREADDSNGSVGEAPSQCPLV